MLKRPVLLVGGIQKNRGLGAGSGGWRRGSLQGTKQQRPGQSDCFLSSNGLFTCLRPAKCGQNNFLKIILNKTIIKVITLGKIRIPLDFFTFTFTLVLMIGIERAS